MNWINANFFFLAVFSGISALISRLFFTDSSFYSFIFFGFFFMILALIKWGDMD